jgi:hypothetical protein
MKLFVIDDIGRVGVLIPFIKRYQQNSHSCLIVTTNNLIFEELTKAFDGNLVFLVNPTQVINKVNFKRFNFHLNFGVSKRILLHYIYLLIKLFRMDFFGRIVRKKVIGKLSRMEAEIVVRIGSNELDLIYCLSDRNLWLDIVATKLSLHYKIPIVIPFLTHLAGPKRLISQSKYWNLGFTKKYYHPLFVHEAIRNYCKEEWDYFLIGSSPNCFVCCNNNVMYRRMLDFGVSNFKLKVCGDLNYLTFDKDKNNDHPNNYLLLSIPQFFEHKLMSTEEHFRVLDAIIRFCKDISINIVCCLHPRSNIEDYRNWAEEKNVIIETELNLIELLSRASWFVCTYSTTYEFSVKLGIKTIMLDHYFNFSLIDGISSNKLLYCHNNSKDLPSIGSVHKYFNGLNPSAKKVDIGLLADFAYKKHTSFD